MKALELQAQGTPPRAAWREGPEPCASAHHAAVPAHASHVKRTAASLNVNGLGAQPGVSVMFRQHADASPLYTSWDPAR